MANKLFWFRIELASDGKVASCAQVDDCGDARAGAVYYLRAASAKSAAKLAYNKYHAVRLAARRERYEAEGRCKCGRRRDGESPAERAFKTCVGCRALHKPQHARATARLKGLPFEPPPSKSDHFAARRVEEKLDTLRQVQDQFQRNTMRNFGLWLAAQIAELEPKAPAKLRAV